MRKRKFDAVESDGAADNQVAMCEKVGLSQGEVASSLLLPEFYLAAAWHVPGFLRRFHTS